MGTSDRENKTKTGFNSPLNRRAFLGLVGKGAIVVALSGSIRFLEPEKVFIRPPGAVTEEKFLSLCIRCQKCQEVCPEEVITTVLLTESIISVGTPKLDLSLGWCTFGEFMGCMGYCFRDCPTGALKNVWA